MKQDRPHVLSSHNPSGVPDSSTKNLLPAQAPCPFPLAASAQRSMATVLAAQIAALKQQLGMPL